MKKLIYLFVILFFTKLLIPTIAQAHRMTIFAWAEGKKVYGETSFSTKRKPVHVSITVQDPQSDTTFLTLLTDNQGKFSFQLTPQMLEEHPDLLFVVKTHDGHRAQWLLTADEYLTAAAKTAEETNGRSSMPSIAKPHKIMRPESMSMGVQQQQAIYIRHIVDQELEKKLGPIRKQLAQKNITSIRLRDILGGLGCIIGLAGIIAWLQSKKNVQNSMKTFILFFTFALLTASPKLIYAHFGMVIPSANYVTPDHRELSVQLSFSHPFEGTGMDMARPDRFFMTTGSTTTELHDKLKQISVMGKKSWKTKITMKRPGVYWFAMQPAPYWEPAEDIFIIHLTKTAVAVFGGQEDWDKPLGLETEIIPLLRPFGNYAGNSFTGKVLIHGQPAPHIAVEVELFNKDKKITPPSDYHITQIITTDSTGVFTFSCPQPGWWGFAALSEADYTLPGPDGAPKHVELGAVLWTYMDPYSHQ